MKNNFWQKLKRPIVGLAPMDGVTDAPMRYITAKYGHPDVTFTEFVSVEGIWHTSRTQELENSKLQDSEKLKIKSKGFERLKKDLIFSEIERPVVAQIFGGEPEAFLQVAKLVVEMGFDGVDINMGCPSKKVAGRGEGAGLIKNPELAAEVIAAVKKGVEGKIPVSVKTRIGYELADPSWWEFLAGQNLAAVTIHGRTFRQLYQGKADWEAIGEAAKIIKSDKTIFLGNGDVDSMENAKLKIENYGVDGVLIGRAAGGNPWVFDPKFQITNHKLQLRFEVMLEHCRKFEEIFPQDRFFIMRKHLSWYARGFDGASELRQKLVLTNSADEVEEVSLEFIGGL